MIRPLFFGGILPYRKNRRLIQMLGEYMNNHPEEPQSEKNQASETYEILPNGKKRYLKATVGDYIFTILLPFWGLLIGSIAILRGEKKRGQTMFLLGVAVLILIALLPLLRF